MVDGLRDWDCVEAVDFPAMIRVLGYIRTHGELPDELDSKEDQNTIGNSGVSLQEVEDVGRVVRESGLEINLKILDGFLLFHDDEVMSLLDAKIFLRAPYEKVWFLGWGK